MRSVEVPVSRERLWEWHLSAGAFERLAPPWVPMRMAGPVAFPGAGGEVCFEARQFGTWLKWRALIDTVEPPSRFVDIQLEGPFRSWRHTHAFEMAKDGGAVLIDDVQYKLPRGVGLVPMASAMAKREVERMFAFRHLRMAEDVRRYPVAIGRGRVILVTGATGLIGRRLLPLLRTLGYSVRQLTRRPSAPTDFHWDPAKGAFDAAALEGVHAIVHLAGEPIAEGRWTASRKRRIRESRENATAFLVEQIRRSMNRPEVLVSASGVNYYGRGPEEKTEQSPSGDGFLAQVCRAWEAAARGAESLGMRTVQLRTGVVLDPAGGALAKMLLPFKMGAGGPIGTGRQRLPWIASDDLTDVIVAAIEDASLSGPLNAVHPQLLEQRAFSQQLGKVLGRPACLPLPAAVVRVLFGEMGQETLLADLPVRPSVLQSRGFRFRHDTVEDALRFILGRFS
jgi:uncharacterized protein (TIGR01777 family)